MFNFSFSFFSSFYSCFEVTSIIESIKDTEYTNTMLSSFFNESTNNIIWILVVT